MTKQDAIKKAYLEIISEEDFNKIQIQENGFTYCFDTDFNADFTLWDFVDNDEYIRPKSLAGIENNNGWIKIESKNDLPIEDLETEYFIIDDDDVHIASLEYIHDNIPYITHYQPLIKPQLPIY